MRILLEGASSVPGKAEVTYQLGLCKHERAEQAQARLELLKRGPDEMPAKEQGKGPPQGRNEPPEPAPLPTPVGAAPRDGAGIQWFATWSSGLKEAERTGRPIFLVAAAPHCAGVSGMW